MADLEAVLADVSYLMAMEKSKSTPAARASKRIQLPDASVYSVMHKYLTARDEVNFSTIFNQKIGFMLFKEFCLEQCEEPVPQINFYEAIKEYEDLQTPEERLVAAREIFDNYIMKELLSCSHSFTMSAIEHVRLLLMKGEVPVGLFLPYDNEIRESLKGKIFDMFLKSDKYVRYLQWKNLELNLNLTMNDFSVHRIIGRGGFGEVYGCRKTDTGKMYAMKSLDKKRIKLKQGETLALNERAMLSFVNNPFIVCMTYAFHTPDKLCFVLDLMNGGDLHYHLTQHGVFDEQSVRFYAAEIILGLEHMHTRFICYRDLKPANILLDENGHVRISDLGLACDFSKKKTTCLCEVKFPSDLSPSMTSLLSGLLQKSVPKRLGCQGMGATELKEHSFFENIDWKEVELRKLQPPLIPPRGEVNAADAFDIGSFDEEDVKGVKLTDADQALYKDFNYVNSERWQQEIAETVFDVVNQEAKKIEAKNKSKNMELSVQNGDCLLHGYLYKLGGPFLSVWTKKYFFLYPNRLEYRGEQWHSQKLLLPLENIQFVDEIVYKTFKCIKIHLKDNREQLVLRADSDTEYNEWFKEICKSYEEAQVQIRTGAKILTSSCGRSNQLCKDDENSVSSTG